MCLAVVGGDRRLRSGLSPAASHLCECRGVPASSLVVRYICFFDHSLQSSGERTSPLECGCIFVLAFDVVIHYGVHISNWVAKCVSPTIDGKSPTQTMFD